MALPKATFRASNIVAPDLSKGLSMIQQPGNLIRGYIDREEKKERQRVADERAQTLFDQQQADRQAEQDYLTRRAEGPQSLQGLLTDAVVGSPEVLQGIELSPEEQAIADKYQTDTGYDLNALHQAGQGATADKLKRQLALSTQADNLAADLIQESRVQMFDRIAREQAEAGLPVSKSLVAAQDAARLAETKAQQDAKKLATNNLKEIRDAESELLVALGKAKDRAVKAGYKGNFTEKDRVNNRADLLGVVRDVSEGKEIDFKRQQEVGQVAQKTYDGLISDGVDPITAKSIIENSIVAQPDKWYTWGGKLDIPSKFVQALKQDALQAQAASGTGPFAGGGNEIAALRLRSKQLLDQRNAAKSDLAQALLGVEEGQRAQALRGLDTSGFETPTTVPTRSTLASSIEQPSQDVQPVTNIEDDIEGGSLPPSPDGPEVDGLGQSFYTYNGKPVTGSQLVEEILGGDVIKQLDDAVKDYMYGENKTEREEQRDRGLNIVSLAMSDTNALTGNQRRWLEDMQKTPNGRRTLATYEDMIRRARIKANQ